MKKTTIFLITILLLAVSHNLFAIELHYTLSKNGMPDISLQGKSIFSITTPFWGNNWKYASVKNKPDENDFNHWTGEVKRNLFFTMDTHWDLSSKNKMTGTFIFNIPKTVSPAIGGGFEFKLPLKELKIRMNASMPTLLEDNRGWELHFGKDKLIRITFSPKPSSIYFEKGNKSKIRCMLFTKSMPKGKHSFTMTIEMPNNSIRTPSIRERYGKSDYSNWFENALHPTKSFIDLSYLNHKPAGKYGFIARSGDHFVRGDGETIKFWGCNIQAYTLFMKNRDLIKAHAKRIAALGFNLVRLHHMDSQRWVKNCLIEMGDTSQELNQNALDTYFYWIKCLKDEGIYLWIDLHVGRMFRKGDNIPGFDEILRKSRKKEIGAEAKGYCYLNDRITELMQQFNEKLLTTVNPYTGLALKDEPAVMSFMLTNENDLTHHFGNALLANKNVPFHNKLFRQKADQFVKKLKNNPQSTTTAQIPNSHGMITEIYTKLTGKQAQETTPQSTITSANIRKTWLPGVSKIFLNDLEYKWNKKMIKHLRDLGVKQPIDSSHMWGGNPLFSLPALTAGDMIDVHSYSNSEFLTRNPRYTANAVDYIARSQVLGMPLTITEWNSDEKSNTTDSFVLPVFLGATAAFQGWDAPMLYGYSQDNLSGRKIAKWSSHNIPNIMGIMPAISLLYRQQHISEASQTFVAKLNKNTLFMTGSTSVEPAFSTLSLKHKIAVKLPAIEELPWLKTEAIPDNATIFTNLQTDFIPQGQNFIESDTGELSRNWDKGIFTINTPKTQAVIGWLKDAGEITLQDVSFTINTPKAAVLLTSLDNMPLVKSQKILLTTIGRIYKKKNKRLQTPLSEPVSGQIQLKTENDKMILIALNNDGTKKKSIPINKNKNGTWSINLSKNNRCNWYILRKLSAPAY